MTVRLAVRLVVLLAITAALTSHLAADSFGAAVVGGLLIAVFSWLAELLFPAVRWAKHSRSAQPVQDPA